MINLNDLWIQKIESVWSIQIMTESVKNCFKKISGCYGKKKLGFEARYCSLPNIRVFIFGKVIQKQDLKCNLQENALFWNISPH